MSAVRKPLVIYADGTFCRRWIARFRARTGDRVAYLPLQQPGRLRRLGIPLADASRSIQLVTRLARLPLARWIAERVYRKVARHRGLAARVDDVLFGRSTSPPATALVRSLFMRALGGVYLIAFTSLRRQVLGLYGEHGIQPIRQYLEAVRAAVPAHSDAERTGARPPATRALERARLVPTLFWLDASDATLVRACIAGKSAPVRLGRLDTEPADPSVPRPARA